MAETTGHPSRGGAGNPWLRIVRDITDMALLGLCVAVVMMWLGRFWWVADLTSHFAVYYAVMSVLLVVVASAMRRKRAACLGLVLLLLNGWVVGPTFVSWPGEQASAGQPLSLAQVNVLHKNRDSDRVLGMLRRCAADLVFVQELDPWWARVLREADLPYLVVLSQPEEGSFGIMMLAHKSLDVGGGVEIEGVKLLSGAEGFGRPSIEAGLRLDGRFVKVLSIHPPPPTTGHFSAMRNAILRRAKAWADEQAEPHVIIGDLNTTPWSHAFTILTGDGKLRSTLDGRGNQGTWPTHLPMPWLLPIDHCLYSEGLVCVDRRVGEPTGSDHLPLFVELGFRDGMP